MKTRAGLLVLTIVALGGTTVALAQQHGAGRHGGGHGPGSPTDGGAGADASATATAHGPGDAGAVMTSGHGARDASALAAGGDAGAGPVAHGPAPTTFELPMNQRGTGAITHYPIPEQLARNDIPVFVQVHSSAPLDHVSLFYRGQGARRYRELRMAPMGQNLGLPGGYGAQVPCEDAFPPAVEYYVDAVATSGVAVGGAGSSGTPITLPVVLNRTRAIVPTLPGQPAPRSCGTISGAVAEHGGTSTSGAGARDAGAGASFGSADLGEPCTHNSDCSHGLRCGTNHRCVFISAQ